jgi:hypothetical protein
LSSGPGAAALLLLGLGACTEDLLPGELVVPGEVAAEVFYGDEDAALGSGVAVDEGRLLGGAPGLGEVHFLGEGGASAGDPGLGGWVWWLDGVAYAGRAGAGIYALDAGEATLLVSTPGARTYALGETSRGPRAASVTEAGVQLWTLDGALVERLVVPGVQRVALGWDRLLLVACEGEACEALAWYPDTAELAVLGGAGDGGAVVEVDGVAWWGDPELGRQGAAGRVCAEDGRCIDGLEGDHLGRSLCASHAAGVFNTWIVPARLRLVPLEGGAVLAVDQGTSARAPALHCDGSWLAIGMPHDGLHQRGQGRVLLAELGS